MLGVSPTATDKEITRAYRKLAKQHHPDAHPGSEERFKEIASAYDVLGDEKKRKEYDEIRRLGPLRGGFAGAGRSSSGTARPGQGFSFRLDDLGDLGDLFGDVLNRNRRSSRGTGPQRGADLQAELHLSFEDAIHGVTTTVSVVSDAPCSTCGGSGAAPGTSPRVCTTCAGIGTVADDQGLFSLSRTCPDCGGTGRIIENPCPACKGTGVEQRSRKVKARIPAGVEDGSRIRIKGRGSTGRNGGPPGDLYVIVHVAPHPIFGRRGTNLTVTVPVTFPEAALGADVQVPTLGDPVTVRIPPGTSSGRTFRVRGRGVHPASGPPGDLLVTVDVVVPKNLSSEERAALETLKRVSHQSPRAKLGV